MPSGPISRKRVVFWSARVRRVAEPAARLATQLLVEAAGARWVGQTHAHERLPEWPVIHFRPERADELIGIATPPAEQIDWLERLGFEHRGVEVITPTWRARDVTREVDVVEEVARKRLEEVPFTLPTRREMFGALTPLQRLRRRVEDVLAGLGAHRDVHVLRPTFHPAPSARSANTRWVTFCFISTSDSSL